MFFLVVVGVCVDKILIGRQERNSSLFVVLKTSLFGVEELIFFV